MKEFNNKFSQVQMGEELLAQGEIESGVEHLSNAVAVCGQPQQLLQVLQQTLPPQVFRLLLERLPIVGQVCFEKDKVLLVILIKLLNIFTEIDAECGAIWIRNGRR